MVDSELKYREREAELIKIIAAIDEVLKTEAWQILRTLVFDGLVGRIERLLLAEAKRDEPQTSNLYKLQGELTWAKRYGDLKSYAEMLRKELQGIKENLK